MLTIQLILYSIIVRMEWWNNIFMLHEQNS